MRTVLHVGCGYAPLPAWLDGYREVRLDIDPECKPDILAPMQHLGEIGPYDAVLANHCLEHLYPHEVIPCLEGFRRVLATGGYAAVFVPDLEDAKPTDDVLFVSPAGPIAGLDLFYGFREAIKSGMQYMAHHTGFTAKALEEALRASGFSICSTSRLSTYNLMGVGIK